MQFSSSKFNNTNITKILLSSHLLIIQSLYIQPNIHITKTRIVNIQFVSTGKIVLEIVYEFDSVVSVIRTFL